MADEVLTLQVRMESARTQRELEELRRKATALRKDQVIGSQEFTKAAKVEVDLKNKLHNLNVQAYSDNAKMKESYFKLGTELRAHKRAAVELASAVGLDKGALGGIMMAAAGPGGWIALATAGLAGIVLQLKDVRDNAKQAAEEGLARLESAGLKLGQRSTGDLKSRLAGARGALEPLTFQYGGRYGEVGFEAAALAGMVPKADQIRYDILQKIVAESQAELDIREAILVAKKQEITLDEITVTGSPQGAARNIYRYGGQLGPQTYGEYVTSQVGQYGGAPSLGLGFTGLPGSLPSPGRRYGERDPMLEGTISAAESLKDDLEPVWSGIGQSITSVIGGAFSAVFNAARISASQILGGILSAIGGVLMFIPGLQPVGAGLQGLGSVASGFGLTAGGGGSSPSHSGIIRSSKRSGPVVQVQGFISGSDIFIASNRSQLVLARHSV